jgi:hypothetical protein
VRLILYFGWEYRPSLAFYGNDPGGCKSIHQHAIASCSRILKGLHQCSSELTDIKRGHARGYRMGVMFTRRQGDAVVNANWVPMIKLDQESDSRLAIRPLIASGVPTRLGVDTPRMRGQGSELVKVLISRIYPQVCPWSLSDQSYCETAAEGAEYGLASGRNESEAVETLVLLKIQSVRRQCFWSLEPEGLDAPSPP